MAASRIMKIAKRLTATLITVALLATPLVGFAADKKAKLKPYTLKTCPVSDEKLGEMGDAYVFEHEGREIKLCCKSCLKDFKKNPAKYVKKIEQAEAKEKEKAKKS
jgi:YHS domain-containing protein